MLAGGSSSSALCWNRIAPVSASIKIAALARVPKFLLCPASAEPKLSAATASIANDRKIALPMRQLAKNDMSAFRILLISHLPQTIKATALWCQRYRPACLSLFQYMNTIGNSKIRDLRDDGSSLGFIEGSELHAKNWLWP